IDSLYSRPSACQFLCWGSAFNRLSYHWIKILTNACFIRHDYECDPLSWTVHRRCPSARCRRFSGSDDGCLGSARTLVAQQIESNFISPNVMGRVLSLHPLTVITIILAGGSIAGFLGILFAVPFYAVIKTIVIHFYQTYRQSKEHE